MEAFCMSFSQPAPQVPPCLFEKEPLFKALFSKSELQSLEVFSKKLSFDTKAHYAYPEHTPYSPFGERVDDIKMSSYWQDYHDFSAREGLVAMGYDESLKNTRCYQMAHLYLFHPVSAFFSCPLAMTDGAALALKQKARPQLQQIFLPHLLSRDSKEFWTSGQWMTELIGGSDVSQTETQAVFSQGLYHLTGTKWFSSATTSQMALALAQTSQGLSLFALRLRDEKGKLQNITVRRLKDKLGTKALPTAELELKGTPAYLIGEEGEGVKNISPVLNITRLYNSICAVAEARSAVLVAQDYAQKRKAFGQYLWDLPLHKDTLHDLEAQVRACLCFSFFVISLLDKVEKSKAKEEEILLLRLLTPVLKLFTAKYSLKIVSEALESMGGVGYCEDTDFPRRLRDAQVFSIWEGTTNILSLETLKVLKKYPEILEVVKNKASLVCEEKHLKLSHFFKKAPQEREARKISFLLGEVFSLAAMSDWEPDETYIRRFSTMTLS